MSRKIDYNARNFAEVRSELVGFVKQYYPDVYSDFNDASVGMMLLELNAAVGDMLSYHTDRTFNETQISYMQERSSLLELARTFGLNIPGNRPSITIVDWSVTVPVDGDSFNLSYAPIISKGSQATGAGKVFELVEDCDFSSPFTTGGIPNRLIIPNINGDGLIENYTLTKREICLNGFTKTFKRVISREDYKPFLEIILPETNVLSIENILQVEGTNLTTVPSNEEFAVFENNFFEVEALAQAQMFVEDDNTLTDNSGVRPGKWENIPKRFIKEFTDNGFCKIILGGGDQDTSSLNDFVGCQGQVDRIGNFINNLSLGEIPSAGTTLFIKYRVGGGNDSNIGVNSIKGLGTTNVIVNGDQQSINKAVRDSVRVNNPIPAIGGKGTPSVEELRNLIKFNFASQNRAVTIKDYKSRIDLMPGKFGVPFRCGVWEERNKIMVSVLALDENTKLSNRLTTTLKENISEYLSDYRMLNDYIDIGDGKVLNLGFEVDLFVEKGASKSEVVGGVSNVIREYMDINKWDMGDNIYLSQLIENINNVGQVLNVIDLRVYNKVGGEKYSVNEIAQPYLDEDTRQIDLLGLYTLFGEPNGMFEIKFPNQDIKVRIKTT
tara:strand:- start:744 stop:2567 length:1824 start_codon:yes stop_codon:yes gene_type:complete